MSGIAAVRGQPVEHHPPAEPVVDHVAPVALHEAHGLLGALAGLDVVTHQPAQRLVARHPPVEPAPRALDARHRQGIDRVAHLRIALVAAGIESGERTEHLLLEARPLRPGERHVRRHHRRPLGDQRLRREQRIDRELLPAPAANQRVLEQHVVDVMAGIALVACEVEDAIEMDRQVGIHLDQTPVTALVPVVAAPRLVLHVFDREGLRVR